MADGQLLEYAVKIAMNRLVVSAKQLGVWDAGAQLTIAAGARTLDGALVPLLGSALTNYNFVSGDYTRKGGLKGDGATKYLQCVPGNTYPQNDVSLFVIISSASSLTGLTRVAMLAGNMGTGTGSGSSSRIHLGKGNSQVNNNSLYTRCQSIDPPELPSGSANNYTGFFGICRNSGEDYTIRFDHQDIEIANPSNPPGISLMLFFARSSTESNAIPNSNTIGDQGISVFNFARATNLQIWNQILDQYHIDIDAAIP